MAESRRAAGAIPAAPTLLRALPVPTPFSLGRTCAPVAWGGNRWPNLAWRDGVLTWVGWEDGHAVWRTVEQTAPDALAITGSGEPARDAAWARAVLGIDETCPPFADPRLERLRGELSGLRPFAAGSIFEGLVAAIVGQSISVAAAAVAETRLAALFHPGQELGGRRFRPLPRPEPLAAADPALVRTCGVTGRRAAALVAAAGAEVAGQLPDRSQALADPDRARTALRALPLVGPWTAEATLLWGVALADAHPTGDVALLRAARSAYADPALDLRGLDRLADGWRPHRAMAARLLWTSLLGEAGAEPGGGREASRPENEPHAP